MFLIPRRSMREFPPSLHLVTAKKPFLHFLAFRIPEAANASGNRGDFGEEQL